MTLGTFYNHKQMRMIDVLIADDHAIVRRGLRTLIAGEPVSYTHLTLPTSDLV